MLVAFIVPRGRGLLRGGTAAAADLVLLTIAASPCELRLAPTVSRASIVAANVYLHVTRSVRIPLGTGSEMMTAAGPTSRGGSMVPPESPFGHAHRPGYTFRTRAGPAAAASTQSHGLEMMLLEMPLLDMIKFEGVKRRLGPLLTVTNDLMKFEGTTRCLGPHARGGEASAAEPVRASVQLMSGFSVTSMASRRGMPSGGTPATSARTGPRPLKGSPRCAHAWPRASPHPSPHSRLEEMTPLDARLPLLVPRRSMTQRPMRRRPAPGMVVLVAAQLTGAVN